MVIDDGLASPILIGRPAVIKARIAKAGLRIRLGVDVQNTNPEDEPRFCQYWEQYHQLMKRNGATSEVAKAAARRSNTIIGSLMVSPGEADALICGLVGSCAAENALMISQGPLFIPDTYVNEAPNVEQLAEIAWMAAQEVQRFGLLSNVAFLSHSSFGSSKRASTKKMHAARVLSVAQPPAMKCDGELHVDATLQPEIRTAYMGDSTLSGSANLLICPTVDAANILCNVLKTIASGGVTVGPVLTGVARTAHILIPAATVRRVLNVTALAAAANARLTGP
jgi:malate dehydrogenase (oxaloacetate-decarboxylating)(NADP+)